MPDTDSDTQDYIRKNFPFADSFLPSQEKPKPPPEPSPTPEKRTLSPQSTDNLAGVKPPQMPGQPNLRDVPQDVPKPDYDDPIKALQSPVVFLAAMGSLFTRHPLTTAMEAGSAAMDAFHKGQTEIYEQKKKTFDEQVKVALDQNKVELEKYQASWEKYKNDAQRRFVELYAQASANNDPVMIAAAKSGNFEVAEKVILGRVQAQTHADTIMQTEKAKLEAREAMETQLRTDPTIIANAKRIAEYRQAPYTGVAARAPPAAATMSLVDEMTKDGKPYDQTKWISANRAAMAFSTGKEAQLVRSLNVSIDHMETFSALADALKNQDINAVNRIAQKYAQETGDPAPTNFMLAKAIVAKEVVKAIVAGGGGVGEREEISSLVSAANSPAQLKGAIETGKKLLAGQLGGLKKQYESAGGVDFDRFMTPAALDALGRREKPHDKPPGGKTSSGVEWSISQ